VSPWPRTPSANGHRAAKIHGHVRIAEVESHFVGLRLAIGRSHTCGQTLVVEWSTEYGDGRIYRNVTVAELQDGEAVRVTVYWGEPFAAPAWRTELSQALDFDQTALAPCAAAHRRVRRPSMTVWRRLGCPLVG
jgi:hypothetical protein